MQGFEPFVIVSKSLVHWYDECFTGYIEDKVVQIQITHHVGSGYNESLQSLNPQEQQRKSHDRQLDQFSA